MVVKEEERSFMDYVKAVLVVLLWIFAALGAGSLLLMLAARCVIDGLRSQ